MAKGKSTVFFCQNCGYESSKWLGQCPGCREWNTMVEEPAAGKRSGGASGGVPGRSAAAPVSKKHCRDYAEDSYNAANPYFFHGFTPRFFCF